MTDEPSDNMSNDTHDARAERWAFLARMDAWTDAEFKYDEGHPRIAELMHDGSGGGLPFTIRVPAIVDRVRRFAHGVDGFAGTLAFTQHDARATLAMIGQLLMFLQCSADVRNEIVGEGVTRELAPPSYVRGTPRVPRAETRYEEIARKLTLWATEFERAGEYQAGKVLRGARERLATIERGERETDAPPPAVDGSTLSVLAAIEARRYRALRAFVNGNGDTLIVNYHRHEPAITLDSASALDGFADVLGDV